MIKIWGRRTSSNVQKVLWCCDELELDYEQVDVGGPFGGTATSEYRKLNPNGLVPTIEDGGFVLWESNAILRYLADKYGAGRLSPATPEGRAEADRWMCWEQSTLTPAVWPVYFSMVRMPEKKRDPEVLARDIEAAVETLEILDRHLAGRAHVAGAEFSLGDIPAGIWTHRWFALPIERPAQPNLEAWYERLKERAAYRKHVMVELS
ncbi:MAG: glutathione S-transferase family protein [Rhodospirillales bacterium]|nr:glutathione S-transferase family protein [Rhodospirillales bacterium]